MSTRIRGVWLAAETTFGTDPDADGSDYLAVRFDGNPIPVDETEIEDVGSASGRNDPAEMVVTRSGAKLDLAIPFYGFATSAGDGTATPTADVIDLLMANALGAPVQETAGEGVATGSTTANVVLDTAVAGLGAGSLLPVFFNDATVPLRALWRRLAAPATATYNVFPDWPSAPTTTAVAYGVRAWGQGNDLSTGTAGLSALVLVDSILHRLTGGRVMSMSLGGEAGKKDMLNVSIKFDAYEEGATAASRPAITTFPAPMIQTLAPFYWNTTQYATKSVKIDFGIKAVEVGAVAGLNGRGTIEVVEIDPVVTIEPAYASTTWNTAFQAGTVGELLAQFGGSVPAARVNSAAFHALRAQISAAPTEMDDGGYLRNSVSFRVLGSGANGSRRWAVARC